MLADPPFETFELENKGGGSPKLPSQKGGSAKFLVNLTLESQIFDVRFLARWPPVGGQKILGVLRSKKRDF